MRCWSWPDLPEKSEKISEILSRLEHVVKTLDRDTNSVIENFEKASKHYMEYDRYMNASREGKQFVENDIAMIRLLQNDLRKIREDED